MYSGDSIFGNLTFLNKKGRLAPAPFRDVASGQNLLGVNPLTTLEAASGFEAIGFTIVIDQF